MFVMTKNDSPYFVKSYKVWISETVVPYELWQNRQPNLHCLGVLGCLDKLGIPKPKNKKIRPKPCDCVCRICTKQCSIQVPGFKISGNILECNLIIEIRDAKFVQHVFPLNKESHRVLCLKKVPILNLIRQKNLNQERIMKSRNRNKQKTEKNN